MKAPAIVPSRFDISIPCANVTEYIFESNPESNKHWKPEQPVILSADESSFPGYTFDETKRLTKAFACGIWNEGAEGKRVLIYGFLCHDDIIVMLGCLGAGAIVHLSPPLPAWEARKRFEVINPQYVFVAPALRNDISEVLSDMRIPPLHIYEVDPVLRSEQSRYIYSHWSSLLDFEKGPAFTWVQCSGSQSKTTTALILNTSGTTGTTKFTERTHYGLIGNTEQLIYRYNLKPRAEELFLCTFGPSGIGFVLYGLLVPLKARYGTIFMNPRHFSTEKYIRAIKTFRPTALHSPKHTVQELITHSAGADFTSVTSMRTGGSFIPCSLREAWRELHGSDCEVVCGMTEGGIHFASDPSSPVLDESVGELLPNLEAMVVDDTGKVCGKDEVGEIWIRNPFAMKGYCNNPEETTAAFSSDGWLKTGDMGHVSDANMWYISGRKKDLFKRYGRHVSAMMIEQGILEHPHIIDVAVVSVSRHGQHEPEPHAYVVKEANSSLTVDLFLEWVRKELPIQLHPTAGIEFLDTLPIAATGKVNRNALRTKANGEGRKNPVDSGKLEIGGMGSMHARTICRG